MKVLYEKIRIKSDADLPKETGYYEAVFADNEYSRSVYFDDTLASSGRIWWINKVKFYWQVVKQPEFKGDIDTIGNCPNCGVEYHIHK